MRRAAVERNAAAYLECWVSTGAPGPQRGQTPESDGPMQSPLCPALKCDGRKADQPLCAPCCFLNVGHITYAPELL